MFTAGNFRFIREKNFKMINNRIGHPRPAELRADADLLTVALQFASIDLNS